MAEPLRTDPPPYEVRRSDRARRIRVAVEHDGRVVVTLPRRARERDAATAVAELRGWIDRRRAEAAARRAALAGTPGTVPYLGDELTLVPEAGRTRAHRRGDRLLVPAGADAARRVERFYRRAARAEIAPRVEVAAAAVGRACTKLTIRAQRTRWGSCSADGRPELQLAPAARARARPRLRRLARGLPPRRAWTTRRASGRSSSGTCRATASRSAGCAATARGSCCRSCEPRTPRRAATTWEFAPQTHGIDGTVDGELQNDPGRDVGSAGVRVGIVGHVEWVDFAVVDARPRARRHRPRRARTSPRPAAAAASPRCSCGASPARPSFFTALGDDATGERVGRELRERHGVEVHAAARPGPHPRAFTHLDARHERTITVLGAPAAPALDDPLPWERCAQLDGIYVTAADPGALRAARAARVLVATPRDGHGARRAPACASTCSSPAPATPGERRDAARARPAPRLTLLTDGARGGTWAAADGSAGRMGRRAAAGAARRRLRLRRHVRRGADLRPGGGTPLDAALALAARCGARCLTGRGPYGAVLEPA